MERTPQSPPPILCTLNQRERGRRRRRNIWGAQTHWTARGVCLPTPAENMSTCRPARPRDAPVGRQDTIAPTAGAEGAPILRIRNRKSRTQRWTGGMGRAVRRRARRAAPPSPEAARKNQLQARSTTRNLVETVDATEDNEGAAEDLPGYTSTGEDWKIKEV